VSEPSNRTAKVGSRGNNEETTIEYVHITCPYCDFKIESTKHSVSKNKSLLCRTHLTKCPKRPSSSDHNSTGISVDGDVTDGVATETDIDLPLSKKQRVVQHRDCIAREKKIEDRFRSLEERMRLIETTIVSHVPGIQIPLQCEQLVIALKNAIKPHPRIEEIATPVSQSSGSLMSVVGTSQPTFTTELATHMLPSIERALVTGLSDAQSTEVKLFFSQRAINSLTSQLETLRRSFDNSVREKGELEKKLLRVAQGGDVYIRRLQGRGRV
jgi:hypothetical protein